MAEFKEIIYEKKRGGVQLTLNRPDALNAITRSMLKEIHQALDDAETDPEIRAVVITGAGRAFSAGFDQATTSGRRRDMDWPYGMQSGMSAAAVMRYWGADDVKLLRIFEFKKPVIAAVRGWAMGGGCWLALYSHLTIAAEDAVFAQPEVRHGSNTTFMWTLLAGFKNALRYGLVGDHIDAKEALRIGSGQQGRAGRSIARRVLFHRRAHRQGPAGDGQNQSGDFDHGAANDGTARRLEHG